MKRSMGARSILSLFALAFVDFAAPTVHAQDYKAILANPERPEDERLIPHAAPGSKTEVFARSRSTLGQHVVTLAAGENASLVEMGAHAAGAEDLARPQRSLL